MFEWPATFFGEAAREIDPALPYADLRRALQELGDDFELQTAGRTGSIVHVRGDRRTGASRVTHVDLWTDEETGTIVEAEMEIELGGQSWRRLRFESADAAPKDDTFYLPAGHR